MYTNSSNAIHTSRFYILTLTHSSLDYFDFFFSIYFYFKLGALPVKSFMSELHLRSFQMACAQISYVHITRLKWLKSDFCLISDLLKSDLCHFQMWSKIQYISDSWPCNVNARLRWEFIWLFVYIHMLSTVIISKHAVLPICAPCRDMLRVKVRFRLRATVKIEFILCYI